MTSLRKLLTLAVCVSFLGLSFAKTVHIFSEFVKPEKEQAYYEGNVKVEIEEDNLNLYCDSMKVSKYQNEWRIVEANNAEVFFDDGTATSTRLRYDIKLKTGTMSGDVEAEIFDKESTDTILINCDSMEIDLENDIFQGNSTDQVQIYKGKIEASAKSFFYDRKSGKIKLEGDVTLIDHDKNMKMWATSVEITTIDDKMTATNARVELIVEE